MTEDVFTYSLNAFMLTPRCIRLRNPHLELRGSYRRMAEPLDVNGVDRRKRMGGTPMRTLLMDNYDSYTYNLYQFMAEIHQSRAARPSISIDMRPFTRTGGH